MVTKDGPSALHLRTATVPIPITLHKSPELGSELARHLKVTRQEEQEEEEEEEEITEACAGNPGNVMPEDPEGHDVARNTLFVLVVGIAIGVALYNLFKSK